MAAKITKKGKTTPVDAMVGARMRLRRIMIGMTQEKLASGVGLTFQQIQKYEKGTDRISASRLLDFSRVLEVPINYFFDDGIFESSDGISEDNASSYKIDPSVRRDTMELIRYYLHIRKDETRKRFLDLAKTISEFDEQKKETQQLDSDTKGESE